MWNLIAGNLISCLFKAMEAASPALREALKTMVDELDKKAQKTPNPYDNVLISVLRSIVGV